MKILMSCLIAVFTVSVNGYAVAAQSDFIAELENGWAGHWQTISADEFASAGNLFRLLMSDPESPQLNDLLDALALERLNTDKPGLFIIREMQHRQSGRGIFAFRDAGFQPIVLQAPHRRADRLTGKIAADWMYEMPIQILALNSVHRASGADPDAADLARQQRTYFMALVKAATEVYAHPDIVQLHGFANSKRTSRAGKQATVILSAGRKDIVPPVLRVAGCLMQSLESVLIYPLDVQELGGTINPAARWYQAKNVPGFLHVEVSLPVRQRLMDDSAFSQWFGQCTFAR